MRKAPNWKPPATGITQRRRHAVTPVGIAYTRGPSRWEPLGTGGHVSA